MRSRHPHEAELHNSDGVVSHDVDASNNRDVLTAPQQIVDQRRLNDRPSVSWYGRIIITATVLGAGAWELLRHVAAMLTAH